YTCSTQRKLPCATLFSSKLTAHTVIYTLSLHDALPISGARATSPTCSSDGRRRRSSRRGIISCRRSRCSRTNRRRRSAATSSSRSEEHTSELQSLRHLVCRLLLEKKKRVTGPRLYADRL